MKHILFTVTNDLNYDQRMIRICTSLVQNGYNITLIGVKNNDSTALAYKKYNQKRISLLFKKGPAFYIEYNVKLFFYLLFKKADAICCIDLDTILPVYFASVIKRKKRIYDAHEYFSQMKEVVLRPRIYKIWHWIEKTFVPKFTNGYTVSHCIAADFEKLYGVRYETIRNVPNIKKIPPTVTAPKKIVYQGAVNEARGFEYLVPAMQQVDAELYIYGHGNFMAQTQALIKKYHVEEKVFLMGKLLPEQLDDATADAYIGLNLVERIGLSQYYSLANKFFDYIQYSIPQVTMNFPAYSRINDQYQVALLLDEVEPSTISNAINKLLTDKTYYEKLKSNCKPAAEELNWEIEEKKLLTFYRNIFA